MVIRLPGFSPQPPQTGPQPGPDPAWARFTRHTEGEARGVSLHSYRPDVTAYRVLGSEPRPTVTGDGATRERNRHNSSVYVSSASRNAGKSAAGLMRLPVVGEIAAGQYDVTVA